MVLTEAVPCGDKIGERKTIVYETRADPIVIKMAAEKIKNQLFIRFGFLRPRREDIQFVSINKYYKAFMVISGRYAVDYYRKCMYTINVDKRVREVVLVNHKFDPSPSDDQRRSDWSVIRLEGEERLFDEFKASLVVDRCGRDVALERLPSGPSEKNPNETLTVSGVKQVAQDADVNCLRLTVVKRPKDMSRLVTELFETEDRAVIYVPRFRVLYRNIANGEERTVEFDGVTAEKI